MSDIIVNCNVWMKPRVHGEYYIQRTLYKSCRNFTTKSILYREMHIICFVKSIPSQHSGHTQKPTHTLLGEQDKDDPSTIDIHFEGNGSGALAEI